MMIRAHTGFTVDIDASAGSYVYTTPGTLFDDNAKIGYSPGKKRFLKTKNAIRWVYYDVLTQEFIQEKTEISLTDLDTKRQNLYPLCYLNIDSKGLILEYAPLKYDESYNTNPTTVDLSTVSEFRNLAFVTEKNLPVNGVNVVVQNEIYIIVNLFIYDMGDVILGTIQHNGKNITLMEDVSPATCEVTYGYIL